MRVPKYMLQTAIKKYGQSRGCRRIRQPMYTRDIMYFGTLMYLAGAKFINESPENHSTLPDLSTGLKI